MGRCMAGAPRPRASLEALYHDRRFRRCVPTARVSTPSRPDLIIRCFRRCAWYTAQPRRSDLPPTPSLSTPRAFPPPRLALPFPSDPTLMPAGKRRNRPLTRGDMKAYAHRCVIGCDPPGLPIQPHLHARMNTQDHIHTLQ